MRLFGGSKRTWQVWSDNNVIVPLPETRMKGTGVHKRFTRGEVERGAIAMEFYRATGAPIGRIFTLARMIHDDDPEDQKMLAKARKGNVLVWLVVYHPNPQYDDSVAYAWVAGDRVALLDDDRMRHAVVINITRVLAPLRS